MFYTDPDPASGDHPSTQRVVKFIESKGVSQE